MATVFNVKSGDPWLNIDTGTRILELRLTESTIVVGDGKVVTWNLPAEDHPINTRLNINDSVHTTVFDFAGPESVRANLISAVEIPATL